MGIRNNVSEFILLGLIQNKDIEKFFFAVFLVMFSAIVLGNLLIILTIGSSPQLKSPMYFFLTYLTLADICYCSSTAPKMIADLLVEKKTISFEGCITQLFCSHLLGGTEIFVLTAMAYDRYVAICKPLHYTIIMNKSVCSVMVAVAWLVALVHSLLQTFLITSLPFCEPNVIGHYFCDVHPLLKLACADTYIAGLIVIVNSGMVSLSCFVVLSVSYIVILVSLRNHTSEGRCKAFSTCASHVTVMILFFGPCFFIYMRPSTTFSEDKSVAVFYTIVSPMLNPLVYTLRNEEVKNAMRTLWSKNVLSGVK